MFSSRSLMFSSVTFKSLIHFESAFVYGMRRQFNFIILHTTFQFSFSPHCIVLLPLSQINCPYKFSFISGLYFVPLIYVQCSIDLFLSRYYTIVIPIALSYSLKLGSMIPPALFSRLVWLLRAFCISIKVLELFVPVL